MHEDVYSGMRVNFHFASRRVNHNPFLVFATLSQFSFIMSAAFSSNAEAVITRSLDLEEQEKRTGIQRKEQGLSIAEFYDIDQTASEIQSRQLKRVIGMPFICIGIVLSEPLSADCTAVSG